MILNPQQFFLYQHWYGTRTHAYNNQRRVITKPIFSLIYTPPLPKKQAIGRLFIDIESESMVIVLGSVETYCFVSVYISPNLSRSSFHVTLYSQSDTTTKIPKILSVEVFLLRYPRQAALPRTFSGRARTPIILVQVVQATGISQHFFKFICSLPQAVHFSFLFPCCISRVVLIICWWLRTLTSWLMRTSSKGIMR